jgi:hypothetical protein
MKVDGRCHCGQIRYEAQVDADQVPWVTDIRSLQRSAHGLV